MRLPFGLGRRSSSGDGASGGGSVDGASSASSTGSGSGAPATGSATAPAGVPSRAWASLPAIQRTAGEMPLVAAPGSFVETLPGATGLPPILEPLGHEVSALASPGLVVARARAVEAPTAGAIPAPAPAPVQRRASRGGSAAEAAGVAPTAWSDDAGDGDGSAHAEVAPAAAPPPSAPATAPIRTMPTVSRQAIQVPERPLTSAAVAAQPAPVQRAAAAAAVPGAPALPRPSGGMRRVPSPAAAVPQVSREVAQPAPATTSGPAAVSVSRSAADGGPTRRGLGEPLTAVPASAKPVAAVLAGPVVSRSTMSGPLPLAASSLRPVAQRSAASAAEAPALTPRDAAAPGAAGAPPPLPALRLPHLPVSRSAVGDAAPAAGAGAAAAAAPPGTSVAQAPRGPEIRPTAGANPLRPSLGIQRLATDDGDDEAGVAELPSPWWSPADAAPAADTLRSASLPAAPGLPAPTPLQREPAGGNGAPSAGFGPVARSERAGSPGKASRSTPVSAPVQRTMSQARHQDPLPQPVGAGIRSSSSSPSRSEAGVGGASPAPSIGVLASGPVVQTSPATAAASGPAPAAAPSGAPSPVVQREEASAPVALQPAGSSVPSERDLDELAQALFGRIRGRLRNDLIYDREAKGLTFDNV